MLIINQKSFLAFVFLCLSVNLIPAQSKMKIESLKGPVLQSEINSFKSFMLGLPDPLPDNTHNYFVYGVCGVNTEALGTMFELSDDIEILNLMIKNADVMLAGRNNPLTGKLYWTGKRELAWPNTGTKDSLPDIGGTEAGDITGHIAYCAKLIIQTKSVWNDIVPTGDSHNFGKTYIERANTYISECNKSIDTYLLPYFVKKESYGLIFPASEKFGITDRTKANIGKPVPWNQQAMLCNGFLRLAECMELLKVDAERVKLYDKIVETSVTSFIKSVEIYEVNGVKCCKWSYSAYDPIMHYVEDLGHSAYDMYGLYRAYHRGKYNISRDVMMMFANTLKQVIYKKETNTFAGKVNGDIGKRANGTVNNGWLLFPLINPDLYDIIVNTSLKRSETTAQGFAGILWLKHQRYISGIGKN